MMVRKLMERRQEGRLPVNVAVIGNLEESLFQVGGAPRISDLGVKGAQGRRY